MASELPTPNPVDEKVHPSPRRVKKIGPPSFSVSRLGSNLAELDLLYTLSLHRIKVRYKQSLPGPAWAILQPLSLMLIYTVIFSVVTRIPSESAPYSVFVYVALLPWTYFSTALTNASTGLVNEVLAVGDAAFQEKCITRILELKQSGARSIVFISNDLGAVARLCDRVLLLRAGEVICCGNPGEVIAEERTSTSSPRPITPPRPPPIWSSSAPWIGCPI